MKTVGTRVKEEAARTQHPGGTSEEMKAQGQGDSLDYTNETLSMYGW